MTILNEKTVAQLNPGVSVPRYDRRRVTAGIVHIGVGNFHRSHQAMYIDTLMNRGMAMDWGICGVGLQPANARMRDVMTAQDGLYTLVIRNRDGSWDARVIGSIVEFLYAAPTRPRRPSRRWPRRRPGSCRSLSPKAATVSTRSPVNSIHQMPQSWPTCAPGPYRAPFSGS